MSRVCTLCGSPDRAEIDSAIVSGTSYRNIAKRFGTSIAAISRHKTHAANAIQRASEQREEHLGESILDQMRRVQREAWDLLSKTESEGDHRGAIVALREIRGCLESLGEMLATAEPEKNKYSFGKYDLDLLSTEELEVLYGLLDKATPKTQQPERGFAG